MGIVAWSTSLTTTAWPVTAARPLALVSASSGSSTPSKSVTPRIGARHPVAAQHAARAVHQEELRALVGHAVHEPGQRLVVDLLGIERGAHRRAQVGQQRELLDPRLELGELLLELAVRVDDLLGLQIEEPLDVAAPASLAQRVAERHARDQRERRRHREEPAPARHRVHHAEGDRAGRAHQARQPEVPAERGVLPADLPAARVVPARGAGALGDPGARQPPVGREALVLDAGARCTPRAASGSRGAASTGSGRAAGRPPAPRPGRSGSASGRSSASARRRCGDGRSPSSRCPGTSAPRGASSP